MSEHEFYLGDGLYASFDGGAITLRAPRDGGDHYVVLEPDIYSNLRIWIESLPAAAAIREANK